jgi:hypothetical protein
MKLNRYKVGFNNGRATFFRAETVRIAAAKARDYLAFKGRKLNIAWIVRA